MKSEEQLAIQQRINDKFILNADITRNDDSMLNDFQIAQKRHILRQYIVNLQKYIPFEYEQHLMTRFNRALIYFGFEKVGEILESD